MDNHPIPQDVTGFQFRLIGNMTVKQFAYIAVGAVGAVILYYLPIFILIKIVLIPLFILGGVTLAFVPIEGRPVDVMAANFLKALFAPNQFVYHRSGGQLLLSTIHISPKIATQASAPNGQSQQPPTNAQAERARARQQQLQNYLQSLEHNQAADDQAAARVSALFTPATDSAQPGVPTPPPAAQPVTTDAAAQPVAPTVEAAPVPAETTAPAPVPPTTAVPDAATAVLIQKDTEKIAEDEALISQMNAELARAKAQTQPGTTTPTMPQLDPAKVAEIERKLQEIMAAKDQLEQELRSLRASPTSVTPVAAVPVATVPQPVVPQPVAPANAAVAPAPIAGGIPAKGSFPSLPDSPNILLGTVRDSSGNVLPNILVEVTDSDGNPVRAFKTNQLGQFMSATQLKEGTYTVMFEDAKNQYKFDPATVAVKNEILQPLEIAAHDAREALRKALFA